MKLYMRGGRDNDHYIQEYLFEKKKKFYIILGKNVDETVETIDYDSR